MRRRRIAFGVDILDPARRAGDLGECRGEPHRLATNLGAHPVGGIFARPADRHLNQHRRERRHDRSDQYANQAQGIVVFAAATEPEGERREHRDRAGDGRGDRHGQGVTILHMRQFVRHDTGDLFRRQCRQEAGRRGDRGVLGVATGCESIRLGIVHDVDPRHRQVCPRRQVFDDAVVLRGGPCVHFPGMVHRQDHFVGVPVAEHVHAGGDEKGNHHAPGPTNKVTDAHENRRQSGEEHGGSHVVHRFRSSFRTRRSAPFRPSL